jgi:hypothetical protein
MHAVWLAKNSLPGMVPAGTSTGTILPARVVGTTTLLLLPGTILLVHATPTTTTNYSYIRI